LAPQQIEFVPLMEQRSFRADALMQYYEHEKANCKLKPYLKLITSSPVYPVIYDANDTVLSLPPIINGEHSKISLSTRDVFIECTATDLTKAHIVLNMMVTMFSPYCTEPLTVEPVDIIYQQAPPAAFGRGSEGAVGATHQVTPDLSPRTIRASMKYMNSGIGIQIEAERAATLLTRMSMRAVVEGDDVVVSVPPTRPDVLHACDVMEDLAIAYGFNNLVPTVPPTPTEGRQQPLNKLSDLMREALAQAGYTEALTWALCSHDENYSQLRKADDNCAVKVSNPQTLEFQLVRTNLISGLLKTLSHNQGHLQLPIRLFEVSDVAFLDAASDVGARNERRVAVLYSGASSGFEELLGALDRIMLLNGIRFAHEETSMREKDLHTASKSRGVGATYEIVPSNDETFFGGRRTDILLNGAKIGVCGVVHPETLQRFAIPNPCSVLELNLEVILALLMNQ
jgi:phenylalanyl-tRNA synthetase beta chain